MRPRPLFVFTNWLNVVNKFRAVATCLLMGKFGKESANASKVYHIVPDFVVPFVFVLDITFKIQSIYVIAELLVSLARILGAIDGRCDFAFMEMGNCLCRFDARSKPTMIGCHLH